MQVFLKTLAFLVIMGSVAFGQTLRNPEQYYGRGVGRLERGDLEGALADFNKAIEMLPKYSAAYSTRGAVKKRLGDTDGALADYSRAIELTPDVANSEYADAYAERGLARLSRHLDRDAEKDFERYLELNKDGKDYLEQRIKYARYQRDKKRKP